LGFQEKEAIPYYFRLADVFAFATRYDGWAVVINEAIAAGCVVVSSTAAGAPYDLIEHGINGLLFEPEDETTLSGHLQRLAEDTAFREQLAEATKGLVPRISSEGYVGELTP
jgi:glycosyltransferase involved in cell wall biosynthesis